MARTVYLVAFALVALAAVASAQDAPAVTAHNHACKATTVKQAIVLALEGKQDLSDFRKLVAAADIGLTQTPKAARLTVFALTNADLAIRFRTPNDVDKLITDANTIPARKNELNRFVSAFITNSGAFTTSTLTNGQRLTNLLARELTANVATNTGRPEVTITGFEGAPRSDILVIEPNNIRACKSFIHAVTLARRT
jgi:hypothetical protein